MTTIPCNTQTRYIFSSGNVFQKIFPALKPDTDEIRFKARCVQIKMKAAARPRREVKTEFWSCIYQDLKVWLLWEDFSFCSVCFFVLWETDIAQLLMVTLSQYHSISQVLRCFFFIPDHIVASRFPSLTEDADRSFFMLLKHSCLHCSSLGEGSL